MSNTDWMQRSLKHVWHPCTQMKDHEAGGALPLVPIASADGVWLTDFDGRRYIDAVSSWWTNIFGHRHPVIVDRLKAQIDRLDHVLLGGFTPPPVVELSERLAALTGPPGSLRPLFDAVAQTDRSAPPPRPAGMGGPEGREDARRESGCEEGKAKLEDCEPKEVRLFQ